MVTLGEGLEEFYRRHEGHLERVDDGSPPEVEAFFRAHDVAHVLFECDISLLGEGAVKIWTIFGTTLGFWNHIREYRKAQAFEISRRFGPAEVLRDLPRLVWAVPFLIRRARKMHKPWPWGGFEPYLDTPLSEIREEFNIMVRPKP